MTIAEVGSKFLEMFILVLEAAGEETGNTSYKEVSRIIEKNKDELDRAIQSDVSYDILVCLCIILVLADIHTMDKLKLMEPTELQELTIDLYYRYLSKPVRSFSSKHGLPIPKPENTIALIRDIK